RQVRRDPTGPDQRRDGRRMQRDRLGRLLAFHLGPAPPTVDDRDADLVLLRSHIAGHGASLGPMNALAEAQRKMRSVGLPEQAIDVFTAFYHQLEEGASGLIPEADVEPLQDIASIESLDFDTETLRQAAAET